MNSWEFRDAVSVRTNTKALYLVARAPHELSTGKRVDKALHFTIEEGVFKSLSFKTPLSRDSWNYAHFDF